MKVCPSCGTRYTDETLQYCLQDGAPLADTGESAPMDDPITVVRPRNESQYTPAASQPPYAAPKPTGRVVLLTVAATIVLLSLGGLLAWMLFGRTQNGSEPNRSNTTVSAEATPTRPPNPSPTATAANQNANTSIGREMLAEARREVTAVIADWRSATQAKDIDSYMSRYADTVAYYTDPSVSRAQVRSDKERAFSIYDKVELEISNINTTIDPSGENAVATFDKEWEFEGESRSRGKVRSELKLKKVNGEWLITSERDQKVYYVE